MLNLYVHYVIYITSMYKNLIITLKGHSQKLKKKFLLAQSMYK